MQDQQVQLYVRKKMNFWNNFHSLVFSSIFSKATEKELGVLLSARIALSYAAYL